MPAAQSGRRREPAPPRFLPRLANLLACSFAPSACPRLQQRPAVPITPRTAVRPEACSCLSFSQSPGSTQGAPRLRGGASGSEPRRPGRREGFAARSVRSVATLLPLGLGLAVPTASGTEAEVHGSQLSALAVTGNVRLSSPPWQFLKSFLLRKYLAHRYPATRVARQI